MASRAIRTHDLDIPSLPHPWEGTKDESGKGRGREDLRSLYGGRLKDLQLGSLRLQRRYRRHTLRHPLHLRPGRRRRLDLAGGGRRKGVRGDGRRRSRPACCRRCHN